MRTRHPKILLVDDDPAVRRVLNHFLTLTGFTVAECADGEEALGRITAENPALILLDLEMPNLDGWGTLARLREQGCRTPVLVLTQAGDVAAKVRGLQSGADDYVTKPCDFTELSARIRAILRRTAAPAHKPRLRIGAAVVDLETHSATLDGVPLRLTSKEHSLLALLAQHRGKPVRREHLLASVWGLGDTANTHTLDTHVWRLRHKLGDHAAAEPAIRNFPGVGFALFCELEPQS